LTTQTVVSIGATRLFAGIGFGAVAALSVVMVVLVDEFRLTRLTSASVPVFTDQRSTPHCANNEEGRIRIVATNSNHVRRDVLMLFLRPALDCDQLLSLVIYGRETRFSIKNA